MTAFCFTTTNCIHRHCNSGPHDMSRLTIVFVVIRKYLVLTSQTRLHQITDHEMASRDSLSMSRTIKKATKEKEKEKEKRIHNIIMDR